MKLRYRVLGVILILMVVTLSALALMLSHTSPCGTAPGLSAGAASMKAMVHRCYGSPDVIKVEAVAKPTVADNELLIRVHAASINPLDWHFMLGKPFIMRPMTGLGAPKNIRLGVDYAGTVEAVGKKVTRYRTGDEVYGGATGAFAEYVSAKDDGALALKPTNMSFEQAAAAPIAAITALQALRDEGKVQAGQRVLVNGASGGVGTFAVQIAKAFGAEVTGVCSARNVALVRSIGADHVIDYTREDFTAGLQRYDLIIDTVGNHSLRGYRRVLTPKGTLVMIGGSSEDFGLGFVSGLLKARLMAMFVSQKMGFFLADLKHEDLDVLRELMQSGKVTPVIDRTFPLSQAPEAIRYLQGGHARGKVVLTVE
jgi:NADPH:quinone reductase-like Zn-dependent oxidoreductase